LKANSKDAHFADALISDLLSLKGQLEHQPTLVHIAEDDVASRFDGAHFEMCVTNDGTAVYRTRGGYTIVADYGLTSLNRTIRNFISLSKNEVKLSDEEMEAVLLDLDANAHVLNIPMLAFSDINFKFELAKMVINFLRETYDEAMNTPLQDETPEENKVFKDGITAIHNTVDELKSLAEE
jgi:hypothetical protein